jgi:hypothetical protein
MTTRSGRRRPVQAPRWRPGLRLRRRTHWCVIGRFELQPSLRLTVQSARPFPAFLSLDVDWNRHDSRQRVGEIGVGARF